MEKPRTVTFKECELQGEGVGPTGIAWQRYQYYGDDGEHYTLFGKHDLEKPYTLIQEESVSKKNGKTYTNWVVVKETKAGAGAGVKLILDKLEVLSAEIGDVKRLVEQVVQIKNKEIDADLPF